MAQVGNSPAGWEKSVSAARGAKTARNERWKFWVGGLLILGAVAYLILSNTLGGARFFINVRDLTAEPARYADETVRVTGAVIGDTIHYDPENLLITFTVANIPDQYTDLGEALHLAVNDTAAERIQVRVEGQVMPELLRHEAQAIMTGTLGADGVFHVSELNLKCPTRFTETGPDGTIIVPEGDGQVHPQIENAPSV